MNWDSIGFDWNRARAFLATAEAGSYSGAARALNTTQPTIGRQIAALEEELGVALFERAGRGLQPTPAGLDLVEHVRAMAEAALRVSRTAAGRSDDLIGPVRISASEVITAHLLAPAIAQIRALHPGIELELIATNEASDLRQQEADVAIRNFRPQDPELVARRLPPRRGFMYASPGYIEQIGGISSADDLRNATFFAFNRSPMMVNFMQQLGAPIEAEQFSILCANHLAQWELCKRGLGVCFIMEEVGEAEPAVVRLDTGLPPVPVQMWLTSHREVRTSRRVRVVFDLLAEALSA